MGIDGLISVEEAAKILARSANTVRNWEREKRIPSVRRLGRIFFKREELEKIAAQETLPAPSKKKSAR